MFPGHRRNDVENYQADSALHDDDVIEWFKNTHSLVIPDGLQLGDEHGQREDGEEQRFKDKEHQQHHGSGWGVRGTVLPLQSDTHVELVGDQEQ